MACWVGPDSPGRSAPVKFTWGLLGCALGLRVEVEAGWKGVVGVDCGMLAC